MRHRKKLKKFGVSGSYNHALLNNLATSLLQYKRIRTTLAKAKALRPYVEQIITKAKEDTVHSRRMVYRDIRDRQVVKELFTDIASKIAERNGGYTRIIKLGSRFGDSAEMAIIELVDYNDVVNQRIQEAKDKKEAVKEEKSTVEAPAEKA